MLALGVAEVCCPVALEREAFGGSTGMSKGGGIMNEAQLGTTATTEGLHDFLRSLADLRRRETCGTSSLLRFIELAGTSRTVAPTGSTRPPLNPARLRDVLSVLGEALRRAPPARASLNVWSVAGLRRDEIRNAAVLAWLLDPHASHGFGTAVLRAFLDEVARGTRGWPNLDSDLSRATVVVEEWPLGSETDRVDIAINGPNFALFVEVKIDASEGPDQLRRYTEAIEKKAQTLGREHGRVIYLSPRPPGNPPPGLAIITWRGIAEALSTLPREGMGGALAMQFARHVRTFF